MMDKAVVQMDALYQSALASGRLRADASLVLEPAVVEDEELENETTIEETDAAIVTGAGASTQPTLSLDDVVRSIQTQSKPTRSPVVTPPAQQPRP